MKRNITRRTFLAQTSGGAGAVVLTGLSWPFIKNAGAVSRTPNAKKLIATTDYYDNILHGKFLFGRAHLDALNRYLSTIGVTRHQWIVDTIWNFYDPSPEGIDLLKEAADSAHQHGLEFYAEIKPFEGGGFGNTYPLSLPFSNDMVALKDIRGIYPIARPFVAANPHMCLKRRPGTYEVKQPVSVIRLVKNDDKPAGIKPEDLTIGTSCRNNGFKEYEGPFTFRESVEWRPAFTKSRKCRIISLEGLQIPADHKYILITCSRRRKNEDFTNERGNIIELSGRDGNNIPFILSTGQVEYSAHRRQYENSMYDQIVRYFQNPEVKKEFIDRENAEKHYGDFFSFDERRRITEMYSIDKEGYIAVACGKPEYMQGNLHPIYPDVREHWLDMINYCLERGADGINIRHSNHTMLPEDWEYGFNDAVIEAAGGRTDYPAIRRINGNAYTQFLHQARDMVKSRGKSLVIHLYSQMLMPDDRIGRTNYIPPNFEWQWETWIHEIADELEFRGAWTLRPWNIRQVLETFSKVTSSANKPFYFQGNMKELDFNNPYKYKFTREEIDMVHNNPAYDGFILYETANFTRMNKDGTIQGSPELEKLLNNYK